MPLSPGLQDSHMHGSGIFLREMQRQRVRTAPGGLLSRQKKNQGGAVWTICCCGCNAMLRGSFFGADMMVVVVDGRGGKAVARIRRGA
jgi:gamma-glutamylcysteine synthetase